MGVHRVKEKTKQVKGDQIISTGVTWIGSLGLLRERSEDEKSGMNILAPYKAPRREEVVFPHPVLRE